MKKGIILFAVILLSAPGVLARNIWDDFSTHVTEKNVRPFAKDLGGLIGSGTYTTGRVLGWGGFQIGPRGSMIFKMSEANGETSADKKKTALGDRDDVGSVF